MVVRRRDQERLDTVFFHFIFAHRDVVIATAAELQVTVQAYSPLGRGVLTGQIKKVEDIPEGDLRRSFDRFKPEVCR